MTRRSDRPKHRVQPADTRSARLGANPDDTNDQTPRWSVSIFDDAGAWGRAKCPGDGFWVHVLPKLRSYETRTWGKILQARKRDHFVSVGDLIKEARTRLVELRLVDYEELFRFRFTGEQRLWGVREGRVFKALWWDPEHEICPSTLRNT